MKVLVNRVTNANVYIDGNSLLGRAEEIDLPEIKYKMQEHKGLGLLGSAEFFAGVDKMEARIKWNSFYPEMLLKAGDPRKVVQLQARASLETYTGQGVASEVPLVVHFAGTFKNFPTGKFKQHENVELETNMSVFYVKQVISGEEILEVDVLANIYKVAGKDVFAKYRAFIGS